MTGKQEDRDVSAEAQAPQQLAPEDMAATKAGATAHTATAGEGKEGSGADKLAQAEARCNEMQDAYLRAKAEVENMRRRAQDDIGRAHKFAIESFAEALVPVKDNLETALKIETPSVESLKEGVEMTLKQMNSAFEKHRLVEVNPSQGEKLDPMKHQALSLVAADQEPNTIVEVLQKGYMIADRLLRPALVTVAQ